MDLSSNLNLTKASPFGGGGTRQRDGEGEKQKVTTKLALSPAIAGALPEGEPLVGTSFRDKLGFAGVVHPARVILSVADAFAMRMREVELRSSARL